MTAALAALRHEGRARRIEHHDRFRDESAAFGSAEREHIDAGLPGQLRGVALRRTSALPKRAPSMCTASERRCAIAASAAISSDR